MSNKLSHQKCLETAITFYTPAAKTFHGLTKQWQGTEYMDAFISELPKSDKPILDLGCGVGRDVAYFTEKGENIYGIDATASMIAFAQENFPECKYELGDALKWKAEEKSHRGIWMPSVFQEFPREYRQSLLKNIHHALIDGGLFYTNWRVGESNGTMMSSDYSEDDKEIPRLMCLHTIEEMHGDLENIGFEIIPANDLGFDDSKFNYKKTKFGIEQHKARVFARKI